MKKERRESRRRRHKKQGSVALTAFCVVLAAILLGMGVYVAQWYLNLGRIRAEGERYAQLYGGRGDAPEAVQLTVEPRATRTPAVRPTPEPTPVPTAVPTSTPTAAPTATPTAAQTPEPTVAPTPTPTAAPAVGPDADMPVVVDERLPESATPSPAVASPATQSPIPAAAPDADMPVPVDEPIPTPDGDTLVIALPTPPPVQESFAPLLALNPDTVGFLEIEGMLSLPVVQRPNDNAFYLDHNFEGAKALEGTLFLDGMNRLVPEDDCLIVYGHNMKNHTMFGRLSAYGDINHLRQHPVVRFDTLYENRSYVAFAAFPASMKPGDSRYFDVRHFIFDEDEFDKFVLKLKGRSVFTMPVDVRYGDRLLLLVTCDYSNREGRFILALRQLRADENEGKLFAQALQAEMK